MFQESDFDVFKVDGLESRMEEIRKRIQPTFRKFQEEVAKLVELSIQQEVYVHIAQHRRRTKYAPENTWSAVSTNKRGYKSEPHFQIGIWEDYVFCYLSMIDNPKHKEEMAEFLLQETFDFPKDFVYSVDHTSPKYFSISAGFEDALERFSAIKKGEMEIGCVFPKNFFKTATEKEQLAAFLNTVKTLLPLYQNLILINQG